MEKALFWTVPDSRTVQNSAFSINFFFFARPIETSVDMTSNIKYWPSRLLLNLWGFTIFNVLQVNDIYYHVGGFSE